MSLQRPDLGKEIPGGQEFSRPILMRSHMYAVQYRNNEMARETLAGARSGRGLDACARCKSCHIECRNQVQIGRKIQELKLRLNRADA